MNKCRLSGADNLPDIEMILLVGEGRGGKRLRHLAPGRQGFWWGREPWEDLGMEVPEAQPIERDDADERENEAGGEDEEHDGGHVLMVSDLARNQQPEDTENHTR